MRKNRSTPQTVKDPLSIIDAIFVTKAHQKVTAGATGFIGASLIGLSIIIASIKPEDTYPTTKS